MFPHRLANHYRVWHEPISGRYTWGKVTKLSICKRAVHLETPINRDENAAVVKKTKYCIRYALYVAASTMQIVGRIYSLSLFLSPPPPPPPHTHTQRGVVRIPLFQPPFAQPHQKSCRDHTKNTFYLFVCFWKCNPLFTVQLLLFLSVVHVCPPPPPPPGLFMFKWQRKAYINRQKIGSFQ